MKASSTRRTGVRTLSTGCFSDVAPEQLAPEGAVRGLQVAEALEPARQVGQLDGVAADRAVGMADRAMKLQVERAEGGDRHRRRPLHHDRQRLAHGDRRIDVDPAGGHQAGDQLELLGDGIEPVLDRRHLAVDDAGGAVDQQAFGGAGGAGQHDDVGDARDQRQRNEGQGQRRDQRQAEGPRTRGGAALARRRDSGGVMARSSVVVKSGHHMGP